MKKKLVIIGNGMSPGRMLETLFSLAPDLYDVTIFNAEPRVNYNRIMLSSVLSGEKSYEDIVIHDDAWYDQHEVVLHKADPIIEINTEEKIVKSRLGVEVDYDNLVIATGSQPFIIPVPGNDLPGVFSYRDLDDVEAMLKTGKQFEQEKGRPARVVVIGGGLLGLEAATGLRLQGMDVSVIHLKEHVMDRQLDAYASSLLRAELEDRGIKVFTEANTEAIIGEEHVEGLRLDDGRVLPADVVIMAVGIRPSIKLGQQANLNVNRGILVDDAMRSSDPNIYALGECAEHRGVCYGLVAPLYEMAMVVAQQLAGNIKSIYEGSVTATQLKVTGVHVYSGGDFASGDDREELVFKDIEQGIYKRIVLEDDKVIGVVLYGDTADGPWFFDRILEKQNIRQQRSTLLFGRHYAETA